jgi:large subunit ribosomal protein L24
MSRWIKKDDTVVVITGNDKGKKGKVLSRVGEKLVVQGVNVRKRHFKKGIRSKVSQILQIEKPIHQCKVALADNEGNPVKLHRKIKKDGSKELIYFSKDKAVLHRTIKK